MPSCKTVSEHFVCGVQTVWQVLTDASAYKDWFGWPETLDLLSAELFLDGSLMLALQAESFQWEGLAAG